jgi:hypothetical protein
MLQIRMSMHQTCQDDCNWRVARTMTDTCVFTYIHVCIHTHIIQVRIWRVVRVMTQTCLLTCT